MGEVIKEYNSIQIKNKDIKIEINKGHKIESPKVIHVQYDSFRIDLNELEFIQSGTSILKAIERIKQLKMLK